LRFVTHKSQTFQSLEQQKVYNISLTQIVSHEVQKLFDTYKLGKVLKGVKHVEPMVVDGGSGHRVVTQIQGLAKLHDEPERYLPNA
jgi:hypothetical protein